MEPNQDVMGPTADASERVGPVRGTSGRQRGTVAGFVLVVALLVGGATAVAATNDSDGTADTTSEAPASSSMVELMDRMHTSPEAQAMHEQMAPELRAQMEQMHAQMREMMGSMGSMMGDEGMGGKGMGGMNR